MKDATVVDFSEFAAASPEQIQISRNDLANMFKVVNRGENSYFNLAGTLNFINMDSIPDSYYKFYSVQTGDTWTNISWDFFNTVDFWWLICKFNGISNPFVMPANGTLLKIPQPILVQSIIETLNER